MSSKSQSELKNIKVSPNNNRCLPVSDQIGIYFHLHHRVGFSLTWMNLTLDFSEQTSFSYSTDIDWTSCKCQRFPRGSNPEANCFLGSCINGAHSKYTSLSLSSPVDGVWVTAMAWKHCKWPAAYECITGLWYKLENSIQQCKHMN